MPPEEGPNIAMLDNWQRIEQLIKFMGFPSVSALAREIGLNRSEILYRIRRGKNGISKELAELITARYPNICKGWLLTGEGEMLLSDAASSQRRSIPYYKADVSQVLSGESPKSDYNILTGVFFDCDFAARTFSAAMSPDIPSGAVVFLRKSSPAEIVPGNPYMIVSHTFKGIRIVRGGSDSDTRRLVPRNAADYDEVTIRISDITDVYAVRGYIVSL